MIRTKAYLLQRLAKEFQQVETLLDQVPETLMEQPEINGHGSVKEIVAHLTAWDRRGTRWIAETLHGETPAVPEPGATWADFERLNAETLQTSRAKTFDEIQAEFRATFEQLLAQVSLVTDLDLERAYRVGGSSTPVVKLRNMIAWRYMHWIHHTKPICTWPKTPR